MKQQSGFTLIELIVVIVILGILAATALPRFSDLSKDARVAKMQGVTAALKSASAVFHATWLVKGSPTATAVTLEGTTIPYINGYPDVGGDGPAADAATAAAASGIYLAAGLSSDYDVTTTAATATTLSILPDANHTACVVTYTQAGAGAAPTIDASAITTTNC
jgi:MSHA pilin protein MshA